MIILPVISFLVSALVLGILLHPLFSKFGLDHPNQRSMHIFPIPRTGGISILSGFFLTCLFISGDEQYILVLGIFIGGLSLMDDLFNLKIIVRFVFQLLVVGIFLFILDFPLQTWLLFIVTLYILWHINLFNFMDGMDGLAVTMSLIGFLSMGVLAFHENFFPMALVLFSISTSLIPFFCFNFSPARIFMGDCGAISLGFISASIGCYGWLEGVWSLFFPIILFFPFIADASLTLLKRLFARENIFKPHKQHYYQRLVGLGVSIKGVWSCYTLIMLLCAILALSTHDMSLVFQGFVTFLLFVIFFVAAISAKFTLRQ